MNTQTTVNNPEHYINCNGIIKLSSQFINSQEQLNPMAYTTCTFNKITNLINNGNIASEGQTIETPDRLKISLKQHQKRIIKEMLKKEKSEYRVSSAINSFILADKVGSGKSIDVLGLICLKPHVDKPTIQNKVEYNVRKYQSFYDFKIECTHRLKTNLVVIPHGIFNQWKNYIEEYTNLSYYGINCRAKIKNLNFSDIENGKFEVILIKSTMYNDLMKEVYNKYPFSVNTKRNKTKYFDDDYNILNEVVYNGPIFDRVFFDEANSIKIPNMYCAYGLYNWFITSSVEDLLYPNGRLRTWQATKYKYSGKSHVIINGIRGTGFIKQTFGRNNGINLSPFLQDLYLKNTDEFIKESFELPEPTIYKIKCHTPPELLALNDVAIPDVINALNAGDMGSALKFANCESKTESGIVDAVISDITKEQNKKQNKLNNKNTILNSLNGEMVELEKKINELNYECVEDLFANIDIISNKQKTVKKSIDTLSKDIDNFQNKLEYIKQRVTNISDKDCPVCAQKIKDPCITPCCKNAFCFTCITMSLNFSEKKECPLCRSSNLKLENLTLINNVSEPIEKDILPTKIVSLVNILNNNPNGKFLVFSEYSNTFSTIVSRFKSSGIKYEFLKGSTGKISNIIDNFKNGNTKVLLLNAKHYGSGLNLQMTTDIVLYHRMSDDLEKQVVGRGNRLGRTSHLNIHKLCYENEL